MNEFLEQMVLAARRRGQDWGNILFVVFLAIFWAISGILKAKKSAQKQKAQGKGFAPKPGGKPSERTKAKPKGPFQQIRAAIEAELQKQRELQQQAQQMLRKPERHRPVVRKIAGRPEQVTNISTQEPVKKTILPGPSAKYGTGIGIKPDFADKTFLNVSDKQGPAAGKTSYLAGILSDYCDSEELKRAILHYEILGRPLSLREPFERIL